MPSANGGYCYLGYLGHNVLTAGITLRIQSTEYVLCSQPEMK